MANINKYFETFKHLIQRDFNLNEALDVIQHNKPVYWSWGVDNIIHIKDKMVILSVNGHHHRGLVAITLGWNDTYSFHLINSDWTVKESVTDVYFDELQERIDKKIEYIDLYNNK